MLYVWYLVVLILQARHIKSSTSWPAGEYALLKPTTRCPPGWIDKGWISQYTMDSNSSNSRSEMLHIAGYVGPSFVFRYFCTKRTDTAGSTTWPKGQYCIHRKGTYSKWKGMEEGMIQMLVEWNKVKYAGSFAKKGNISLYVYFYCQTSGDKNIPIELPITKPFYLLPYGSRECQQVKWMVATSEWINYHTRNYQSYRYKQKYGTVPYHKLGSQTNKGITMYYCYYQSCNYTLTKKNGVFQSPRFPRKYPDGQLCSWRIMVPVNHTIHVHFTNFSLYGNDTKDVLKFSKRIYGRFRLNYTFYGDMPPFTLTGDSDLEFMFRSDEANNSSGFRAKYNMFIPQVSESTPTLFMSPNKPQTTIESDTFTESRIIGRDRTGTIVVIVIPLVCLILIIVLVIDIVLRYRANRLMRRQLSTAMDPKEQHDSQIRQSLTRDPPTATAEHLNRTAHPNDALAEDQMYQSLNNETRIPRYEQVNEQVNLKRTAYVNDASAVDQVYQSLNNETRIPMYEQVNLKRTDEMTHQPRTKCI